MLNAKYKIRLLIENRRGRPAYVFGELGLTLEFGVGSDIRSRFRKHERKARKINLQPRPRSSKQSYITIV